MVITPSATGSIASGSAFWCIVWSIVNHINDIPILGRLVNKEKIYRWINKNKVLSLTGTEIVNFSIHGVSNPLGVMMACGGTVINGLMIFLFVPIRQRRIDKREQVGILRGI